MASNKPVIHGADHRPPGWNGPDDLGGADPLGFLAGTIDLRSAEEYVKDAGTTVTTLSSADLSLSHDAGTALLDYTAPAQPEVLTAGVYGISVSIVVADAAVTVNHYVLTLSVTQALISTQGFHQDTYSSDLGDAIAASVSWTGVFSAGDSFIVRVLNLDSVDRAFFPVTIAVTRILEM